MIFDTGFGATAKQHQAATASRLCKLGFNNNEVRQNVSLMTHTGVDWQKVPQEQDTHPGMNKQKTDGSAEPR